MPDLGEGLTSPPFFNQKQSCKAEVLKTEDGGCFPLTQVLALHLYNYIQYFFLAHRLPTNGPSGEPLYAEAAVAGKKKDAVLECPLEACRMLDASGLLIKGNHHMVIITMQWLLINQFFQWQPL